MKNINNIDELKLDEIKIEQEFNQEQTKKKRGRPKKSETEQTKVDEFKGFGMIVTQIFDNIIVKRLPNPQPLSDDEKFLLGESSEKLINKYSTFLGNYSEETFFGFSLFLILSVRFNKQKNESETENKTETNIKNDETA